MTDDQLQDWVREAQRAAERVDGVTSVPNELEVRILDEHGRQDADLRGAVLQAMALDGLIPKTVDAKADRGLVTLTGTAAWQYQREEAEFVAGNVPGVADVDNQIALTTPAHVPREQGAMWVSVSPPTLHGPRYPAGTRGGRQPGTGDPIGRWLTKRVMNRVRRKGEAMGMGFNALVLTTIRCPSGRERNTVASMVDRDPR
jgi:hypothetical protein